MDKIRRNSRILIIVGIVSVMNAFLAGCIQAEKSYHTEHFTNTHWITIISLFAGIASLLCPSYSLMSTSFILAIIVNIFTLAICSATVIADFFNIIAISRDFNVLIKNAFVTRIQVYGLLSYSTMDMILSAVSVALVLLILSSCHRSFLDVQVERYSMLLSAIGILCVLRVPTNSPTRIITFCLSSISIYPTITYLWIDYRWFANAVEVCEIFYRGSAWCNNYLTIPGTISHFIETLLYFCVFITSTIVAYIIWRIIQINPRRGAYNADTKTTVAIKLEKSIEKIGLALLISGIIVLIVTIYEFIWNSSRHPITVSRDLYANLLHCTCLLMINAVRFADILTQLDYRNIGEVATWSWRIHNTTEVFALGAHFATIIWCLRILDIAGNTRISHALQPIVEFRNPLSTDQTTVQHYTYSFQDV
ncbi:hypothetical protein DINM_006941 [Dirofilaria immitis]|nr:hypothetical protein [Dirofilaria immitis]